MKLSVLERITLQNLLPAKGSYTNLKLLRVAREALSFTDAEHKVLNFRQEGEGDKTRTVWNIQQLVDKRTNLPIKGESDFIMKMVNANPENYEMRPILEDANINLGEVVTHMIIKELKSLEEKELLDQTLFTLFEKFIVSNQSEPLKIVK
uniref:Uncharacterized protein n=1 Tax=viral metagenome TaxID=1070528 RepID=A0A6H1ZNH8_9ZZZZ